MTNQTKTLRKYRVLYYVTRGEYYEIEAANPQEAEELAFSDGHLAETGETTKVEMYQLDEIEALARARIHFDPETSADEKSSASSNLPGFTSEDADRLLGLGDELLDLWEQNNEGADEEDRADYQERRAEWTAIRPLFAAAPQLLKALADAETELERMEAATGKPVDQIALLAIRAALAQAKGGAI